MSVWGDIRRRSEGKQSRTEDKFFINVGSASEVLIEIYKLSREERLKSRLIQVK